MRLSVLVLALGSTVGCAVSPITDDLMLLTRAGCAETETLRRALDQALGVLGQSPQYRIIDQGTLAPDDWRHGYSTPTLLYQGQDVFGLPESTRPYREPTCRIYPNGIPSADTLTKKLQALNAAR